MAVKRYQVVGTSRVFGNKPGSSFTREIPEAQERRLIEGRSIRILGGTKPGKPRAPHGARRKPTEGGTSDG